MEQEYRTLFTGAGIVTLDRTLLEIKGKDRASLLHNLCTNDVLSLEAGQGCEAYFTDVKGRVLAHAFLFAGSDVILLDTAAGQADRLMPHLDKYIIREDVTPEDTSRRWKVLVIAGPEADSILKKCGLRSPEEVLAHAACSVGDVDLVISRLPLLQVDCFALRCPTDQLVPATRLLTEAGAEPVSVATFDAARIENGFPLSSADVLDRFPQEVGRERESVSFTKGCYLGQETVARIDAMGQVNWNLAGLQFEGRDIPQAGTELTHADKAVAKVTSACFSPGRQAVLALAYVRRDAIQEDTKLASPVGMASLIQLPLRR